MKPYPMLFFHLHPADSVKNTVIIKNEIHMRFVMKAIRLIAPREKWFMIRKSDNVIVAQSQACKVSKAYISILLHEREKGA